MYNHDNGYGFLISRDGRRLKFYASDVERNAFLKEKDEVEFSMRGVAKLFDEFLVVVCC
jgi:cold shock CspA family protein